MEVMKMRRSLLGGLGVLLSVLATQVRGGPALQSMQPSDLRSQVVEALGAERLIEGRLADFDYAIFLGASTPRKSGAISKDLVKACGAAQIPEEHLAACALVDLANGRTDLAVKKLEQAASGSRPPAYVYSDLAAAYVAQAGPENGFSQLIRGASTAEKALTSTGVSSAAKFNYALALEKLSLRADALAAWESYIQLDAVSGWSEEARSRIVALKQPSGPDRWQTERNLLLAGPGEQDDSHIRQVVQVYAQPSRQFAEESLLADWARARAAGGVAESIQRLATARAIGTLRAEIWRDSMLKQSVAVIEHALAEPTAPALHDLVAGHRLYGEALDHYKEGQIDQARMKFDESREALLRANSPFEKWVAFQLAVCRYQHAEYASAREILERLVGDEERPEYPVLAARSLRVIGLTRYIEGDLARALRSYFGALLLFEKTGEVENLAGIEESLAETFRRLGDSEQGWRHLGRALSSLSQVQDPFKRQLILQEAADASAALNASEIALLFQDENVKSLGGSKDWNAIAHALQKRSVIEASLGQKAQARQDMEEAKRYAALVKDPKMRLIVQGDLLLSEGQFRSVGAPAEGAERFSEAIAAGERTGYFERLPDLRLERALAYLADGEEEKAEKDLRLAIREIEALRSKIGEQSLRTTFLQRSQRVYDQLIRIDVRHGRPESALETLERTRARVLLDFVTASGGGELISDGTVEVSSLQKAVGPSTALIEYAMLEDRLLIWVVQQERVNVIELMVPAREIEEHIEALLRGIKQETASADTVGMAKWLYGKLIGPITQRWNGKRLIVVPDKGLFSVPFAALVNPATGKFLIEDYEIGIAPSGQLYALSIARSNHVGKEEFRSALVVGDPQFDRRLFPWLPSLPGAAQEAGRVSELLPGSKLLTGSSATREAFLQQAGQAEILHFAGHAFVDRAAPLLSGLVLAPSQPGDSGILYAKDLFKLKFNNTRLVVLAACGTADGRMEGGEGMISLARPFLAAGAPSVVASLWPMSDGATSELFTSFYGNLRSKDAVSALRAAQLETIRRSHAYIRDWAAFEHLGGIIPSTNDHAISGR